MKTWILLSLLSLCCAQEDLQSCDWTGSGRITELSESVGIVALRCFQGKLLWKYPDGAMLIRLKRPQIDTEGHSGGDLIWRTCLRPVSKLHGAAIYRLENGTLIPLIESAKRRRSKVEKCFDTDSSAPVTLYIETDASLDQHKSLAGFHYWSKPTLRSHQKRSIGAVEDAPAQKKCQPCSREEILNAYCNAELVLKGKLVVGDPIESSLKFRVEKLFRKPSDHSDILHRPHPKQNVMEASVILPSECRDEYKLTGDMHTGSGDFLVLAGYWLGQAHMICAPLYEEWLNLRESVEQLRLKVPLECDIRP